MSTTRITQRTVSTTMMQGLQSNLGKLQKLQEQLSSGRQVSRPSDSPVKTVEAMQFRSGLRRTEQHVRNADNGLDVLSTADAALTDSLKMTARARELVLQGLNGANNDEGRRALATELRSLRDGLVAVANTRYLDRPVFGGNAAVADAFDRVTGTYQGDQGAVERTIAPGTRVTVNVTGTDVFGADGDPAQLFEVLDELARAVGDADPAARQAALDGGLVDLDTAVDRIVNTLGEIGARFNRVETVRSAAEGQLITLSQSLSEVENIDLPRTIVDLQLQEVAYKAALGATARVVQPSLLDFLR